MTANITSGPPPKKDGERRRRNATVAMTKLPAEGRPGRAPAWPLGKASKTEAPLWRDLWKTPQAVAWERLGWHRVVARYVRFLVAAESGDMDLAREVRQLEDRLGLTPLAMLRLRWEIVADEVTAKRTEHTGTPAKSSARRRLKIADTGT